MQLFWTKGYQATSMKDLEAVLSMRPGSIYAAFQSKEALFRQTINRYADRMTADLRALIDNSPTPVDALRQHLVNLAELSPSDRPSTACMLVKSLLELPQDAELRDFIIAHLDRVESLIANALRRAREEGELGPRVDPDRLSRRIQTYIFGLKVQAQRETDPKRMQLLCNDLAAEIGSVTAPAS
ncbi:TetR/AcrR family transcriptional regulator [Roseovarius pacificus]|uniref:TetR/AcrR family transcriptional regulator n=1 Tax=Roseovarius pacificus TaxID=337701 RepID=UPI00403A1003